METLLDRRKLIYKKEIRQSYEDIKKVFVQVSGFLILHSASSRVRLEMSDRMWNAMQSLDKIACHMQQVRPPDAYRVSFIQLTQSIDGLKQVLKDVMKAGSTNASSLDVTTDTLRRAYDAFKKAEIYELNLQTVDLSGSCCASHVTTHL